MSRKNFEGRGSQVVGIVKSAVRVEPPIVIGESPPDSIPFVETPEGPPVLKAAAFDLAAYKAARNARRAAKAAGTHVRR